jgi:hypothetical protein
MQELKCEDECVSNKDADGKNQDQLPVHDCRSSGNPFNKKSG